ncbi:WYL domain-containing protein [Cohnella silvisoli]|uniref:WYL domain-containing protein n=1 Tax=Cohnella silvisoli TaxID=2873699 RepID=A0ABV1KN26_9BACL|nr:WYL domain-containing protein [Cohnella silvisoli]MCD9020205.1 WYL domain-containing protein [Cohnella silvisoli]
MNLFEKIFNYQVISRLDEAGSLALTSQERGWLKTLLEHPASSDAFTAGTLAKLQLLLKAEANTEISDVIIEKVKSHERQVYHPLLRTLRRIMIRSGGIRLNYRIKHGGVKSDQTGFPYKLEYSMIKREWYLIWYNTHHHMLMSTKLLNIVSVEEVSLPSDRVEMLKAKLADLLDSRQEQAAIEVVRTYNPELSRILYAFSCFEKTVSYEESSDTYRIQVTFLGDESEFLLSKIRFLGKRVRIVESENLKRRMQESASKALARYGVEEPNLKRL